MTTEFEKLKCKFQNIFIRDATKNNNTFPNQNGQTTLNK